MGRNANPKWKRRPNGSPKEHVSVRIDPDVVNHYRAIAEKEGVTLAQAIEYALRTMMPEEVEHGQAEGLQEQAAGGARPAASDPAPAPLSAVPAMPPALADFRL